MNPARRLSIVFALLLFALPGRGHAYIDPGAGSYLVQIVIAALVGSGFALKLYWKRIRDALHRPKSRDHDAG
ncbi:MAG: hypothetical protein PHN82_04270 [bacterium]|nr:hypothetical protein [bacterium]